MPHIGNRELMGYKFSVKNRQFCWKSVKGSQNASVKCPILKQSGGSNLQCVWEARRGFKRRSQVVFCHHWTDPGGHHQGRSQKVPVEKSHLLKARINISHGLEWCHYPFLAPMTMQSFSLLVKKNWQSFKKTRKSGTLCIKQLRSNTLGFEHVDHRV